MADLDPYKPPESDIGIQADTPSRLWSALDIVVTIFFLLCSTFLLSRPNPDFFIVTIPLGLVYFVIGFCVLRGYAFTKYLLYLNAAFILLSSMFQIYAVRTITPFAVFVLTLGLASIVYALARYRNPKKGFSLLKELKWLALTAVAFVVLLGIYEFLFVPRNLTGPVIIK